jgi:hypothetical protein
MDQVPGEGLPGIPGAAGIRNAGEKRRTVVPGMPRALTMVLPMIFLFN